MARKNKADPKRPIASYEHTDKKRVNNPPVGLVTPGTDPDAGQRQTYAYDPHLDPQLQWAGKAEHTSFEVPTVSLHVHERIDPRTIIEAVKKRNGGGMVQGSLFDLLEENPPLRQAIEFYQHAHGWSNRLIAGDSLLVMNSLLEKEGMAGKVQMVYIDPPYGIKYGSNFQPFVNKRDVKDGKDEDLTAEPEQIRAFRDTWELGIHSYLTYLRDRLLLARELLDESGSIFVQISDENVHHVRELMDEVFGAGNFCGLIAFQKTGGFAPTLLSSVYDYLVWYSKEKQKVKYRKLFRYRSQSMIDSGYAWIEEGSGERRRLSSEEMSGNKPIPDGKRFQSSILVSAGASEKGSKPFEFEGGIFKPAIGTHWKTSKEGLDNLARHGRLILVGNTLAYVRYADDFPVTEFNNVWDDTVRSTYASAKLYVVQTSEKVIQRCLLMTTDPGDLVFDPTCGSGTTAFVAEQWGRRWITCDTSRVALTLARQRLMTAVFDYYELAHPNEGVGSGFNYKTVPHITLKSIANNEPPATETLYDQPLVDRKKHRVSGPFTVEAVPAPAVKSVDELLPSPPFPLPLGEGGRRPGEGKQSLAPDLLAFARHLRKEQTDAEQILWALLRDRRLAGFKFRQQHPIEPYVLDFYCHEARLCIELDGGQHNEPEVKTRDEKRAAFLNGRGIRVLRFWDHEVMKETEAVLEAIYDALTPALSQREREFATDVSIARSGETLRQGEWRDELLRAGIRGKAGQYIRFARLEPLPGCRHLHADGETRPSDEGADSVREKGTAYAPQRIVVSFGPEHAPLEQRQVAQAIEEAQTLVPKPKLIVFAAFQFDPEAAKDIDETNWPGVTLLKAQMNADLLTDDLKKKRASNESFWLIGQPDVRLERIAKGEDKGKWRVSIEGFDYYNTKTGGIESGGAGQIAVWLLDTDYDGRSLYPRQVFFPQAGKKEGWARLAKNLKAEIDEDLIEAYGGAVSLPFEPGEHKRIAVKIVDDRGIESLKIVEVD